MANRVMEVLGIEKPVIQGPLAWLTNGEYAAAVSNAGGLGVIGINAGQTTHPASHVERVENLRREVRRARELTDRPLGLNVAPREPERDLLTGPMLTMMAEEGVQVAIMVGDLIPAWVAKFHEQGIKVVFRAQTPTVENTKAAVAAGVDVIVATGFDEGGTVPEKVIGTFSIVPMIVDATEGKVPVMAAGGIADARTARAAFALGAEGLFVGTAFMMSEESIMATNIKEQALQADADDLLLYRTVPAYYRSLPGELPNELLTMSNNGATEAEVYEKQKGYDGMRNGMLFGDLSDGFASFGLGISLIDQVEPVAVIMDKLMAGIEDLI